MTDTAAAPTSSAPPPETGSSGTTPASLRGVGPLGMTSAMLGPLQELPGFWQGTGFSLIARPDVGSPHGIFLQLNLLLETIDFTAIGSPVPNRGSAQGDISIYGVTYLHRVTDAATGGALHVEPGMWLNIPPTTEPAAGPTIARLLTVPHGNVVCSVGTAQEVDLDGTPTLPSTNTVPFATGTQPPPPGTANPFPEFDLTIPTAFRTSPLAAGITQALVTDPMNAIRDALADQRLTHVTRLITSTSGGGGLGNIPFVTTNANTLGLDSTWAIETVQGAEGPYLQLQYAQTALLEWKGMTFPHVTVGTLVKAF